MTTATDKSTQLTNINNQTFKSELTKISDGLFNCPLTLSNGNTINIPVRGDGYINATKLCQAGGKKFNDWFRRKQTKDLIQALESDTGYHASQLIEVKKGNTSLYDQGSWIHPDLGIQCAQWSSPIFAIEVSRCIRQLYLYGKVDLNDLKTNEQLLNRWKEKALLLQSSIGEVTNRNFMLQKSYTNLKQRYDSNLKKRSHHKFKEGNCCYIIRDEWRVDDYYKVGMASDINGRLQVHRTAMPETKVEYLVYLDNMDILEKCIKIRFVKNLTHSNHEYVSGVTLVDLIDSFNHFIEYLKLEATFEDDLDSYNNYYEQLPQVAPRIVFIDDDEEVADDESEDVNEKINDVDSITSTLSVEFETSSDEELLGYNCKLCNKVYKKKGNLKNHMEKYHSEEGKVSRTCDICDKVFSQAYMVNRHKKTSHGDESRVKCDQCDKDFSSESNMLQHIQMVHEKKGEIECNLCDKTFSRRSGLTQHINNIHNKKTIFKCDQCDKVTSSKGNLQRHIEVVHEKSKTECKICGKMYARANLKQHIDNVHKSSEKTGCKICKQVIKTKKGLAYHMFKIHGVGSSLQGE